MCKILLQALKIWQLTNQIKIPVLTWLSCVIENFFKFKNIEKSKVKNYP